MKTQHDSIKELFSLCKPSQSIFVSHAGSASSRVIAVGRKWITLAGGKKITAEQVIDFWGDTVPTPPDSLPIYETRLAKVGEASPNYAVPITCTVTARQQVQNLLGDYFRERCDQEEFLVMLLTTKNMPICVVRVTRGTLDASLVHPREVFRPAIHAAAAAVILIHNHPSGNPTPSRADHDVTNRLTSVGKEIGITVLDHIIVAGDTTVSIREA